MTNSNSGLKLRVDAYIVYFLANNTEGFATKFRESVKNEAARNPDTDAFQTVLDKVRLEMHKDTKLMIKQGYPGYDEVRVDSKHISTDLRKIESFIDTGIKDAIVNSANDKELKGIVRNFYENGTVPGSKLIPPPGNGIAPPRVALASFEIGAVPSPANGISPEVLKEAMKVGKSCYSMGSFGASLDILFGSDKHADGTFKNPWNKDGLDKVRDSCFDELVVPTVRKNRGSEEDVEAVRAAAKGK